jgi:O-antigen/teichoic acid export membrane protein
MLSVGTGLASQAALLVTGIIAARALGVEDRGHFAFIFLISQIVAVLGTLGTPLALTYFVAYDPRRASRLTWRLRRLALAEIVGTMAVHAALLVVLFGSSSSDIKIAAAISLLTSGSQVAQTYGLALLQGQRRFRAFNVLRLLGPGGYAIAAGVSWVLGGRDLVDLTIAYSAAYVFAFLATVVVAALSIVPVDRSIREGDPDMREMAWFGARGLLGAASPLETFKVDQSLVGFFLAPAALGLYVTAIAFTNLPKFLAQSIGMVAYPYIAHEHNARARRRTMWRFVALSTLVCAAIVGVLEVSVGSLIPLLFGSAFSAAIPVARILLVAGFLISVRRILADGARGIGRPGVSSIAELVSWVVLVPALLVCVHFGLEAVAWGLTGSAAVSVGVLLVLLLTKHASVPTPLVNVAANQG